MSGSICSHLLINETPFQAVRQPLRDVSLKFPADSRWTKQCFKEESDINSIMARYQSTGEIPNLDVRAPQYLDATGMDFQSMQNQVVEARALFMELPSKLRTRFANDPGEFLAYVADPQNHAEMRELGLMHKAVSPAVEKPQEGPSA